MLDTQHAFDGVAADYDRSNAENPILCAMRERVLAAVGRACAARRPHPRSRLRSWRRRRALARPGYRSPRSTGRRRWSTRRGARIARRGLADRVDVQHLGSTSSIACRRRASTRRIRTSARSTACRIWRDAARHDCRAPAAGRRARRLGDRPGLPVGDRAVSSRAATGRARACGLRAGSCRAAERPHGVDAVLHAGGSSQRAFAAAGFTRVSLRALGLFAPPPYLEAFASGIRA